MPDHCILTKNELRMILAVVRADHLPGLEEITLEMETDIGEAEKESLYRNGLLQKNRDGRFSLERTSGYIFSGLSKCDTFYRGTIVFPNSLAARLNIYLLDDSFVSILWNEENSIECTWLPTFPLAMGTLIHFLNNLTQLASAATIPADSHLHPADDFILHGKAVMQKAVTDDHITAEAVLRFIGYGDLSGKEQNVHSYLIAKEQQYYLLGSHEGVDSLQAVTISELLQDLSSRLFSAHRKRIMEAAHE